MFSIIKFLKSLNSIQAEYQLSLALAFGMISGFLPFFSLLNILVVIIVFSLNIPIGIYSVFVALFTIVGSLFDPYFHDFGLFLLTNDSLKPLWISLYESPLALWANYNHTITLGSFIISLILFIPTYFISKFLFIKYKKLFQQLFQNKKYLSWLNPYSEKSTKKEPLFRWWGSLFILSFIGAISAFVIILLDPILKNGLEFGLSKITKHKVYIKDLETNLNNIDLNISNISIIKHNKATKIDNITININPKELLYKKFHIENIDIKNISFDNKTVAVAPITTNKQNSKTTHKSNSNSLDKFKIKLPNINTLLAKEDLKSVQGTKQIKQDLDDINSRWSNINKTDLQSSNIDPIKQQFNEIKQLAKHIKSKKDLKTIIAKTKQLKKDIQNIQTQINTLKQQYKNDKNTISTDLKLAKQLPNEDYNYLLSKYSFDQHGALNIVSTYIGKDVKNYVEQFLKYYKIIKPYLPKKEADKEVKREHGQWISFAKKDSSAKFILKKLTANIVSKDFNSCTIIGSYNKQINLALNLNDYNKKKIVLDKSVYLTQNHININGSATITDFTDISTNIHTKFTQTKFIVNNPKHKAQKTIKNILDNINNFYIDTNIVAKIEHIKNMKLSVKSDLNKKLSSGFKKQADIQIAQYKQKLKNALKQQIQNKIGNINPKQLDKYMELLNNREKLINQIKYDLKHKYNQNAIKYKLQQKLKKRLDEKKQQAKAKAKAKAEQRKKELKKKEKQKEKELKAKLKNKLKSLF